MVQLSKITAAALLVPAAFGAPVQTRQAALTDAEILQFALILEHLENVFYKGALSKWPESEFVAAGFSAQYYNNLKYIAHDEQDHVLLLEAGLTAAGAMPVAACEYSFPYTDVAGFVGLASILEGVGSSAYLGAAPAITSKEYLAIAGSILVTEAIHTAIHRLALNEVAAASPYGSALIPDSAYTLASAFIVSCPSTNVALPFSAFPTLTATQGIPAAPGIPFTFTTAATLPESFFVTFTSGLTTTSVPATVSGGMISAVIPAAGIYGQSYAILTNANTTAITNDQVIAGPAIIEVTPDSPTYDISIQ